MRNPSRLLAGIVALTTATGLAVAAGSSSSALASGSDSLRRSSAPQGDTAAAKDKDNRHGRLNPSATQQAKADALDALVSWNSYGTPALSKAELADRLGALVRGFEQE